MAGKKKILYINRKPPHGSSAAQEALDIVLIGAAFEQEVSLAFIDDGVWQLRAGQDTSSIERRNVAKSLRALGDYDIRWIYVEAESLQERGLDEADLLDVRHENPEDDYRSTRSIRVVSREKLTRLIARQDVVTAL